MSPLTYDAMLDAAISWFDSNGINTLEPEQLASLVQSLHIHVTDTLAGVEAGPIYQMRLADGKWIDQSKESYDYNVKHGHGPYLRVVYTLPQATPQAGGGAEHGGQHRANWVCILNQGA